MRLLLGVALTEPVAARIQRAAQDAGFLVNAAGPGIVRLAPALTMTEGQAEALMTALPAILDAASRPQAEDMERLAEAVADAVRPGPVVRHD